MRTILPIIHFTVVGLALAAVMYRLKRPRTDMPVTFKSLDEERGVYQVARWAAAQLDPRTRDVQLRNSLCLWGYSMNYSWMGRIPVSELVILQPFIDLVIDGKGPRKSFPANTTILALKFLADSRSACRRRGFGRMP